MSKWGVSRKELADLLDLSLQQVERWFFKPESSNYQEAQPRHLRRLAEIDFLFEMMERSQQNLQACPEHLKKYFRPR